MLFVVTETTNAVVMFGHQSLLYMLLFCFCVHMDVKMHRHNLIIITLDSPRHLHFTASQSMHLPPRIKLKK
jgi:hypothetical protein